MVLRLKARHRLWLLYIGIAIAIVSAVIFSMTLAWAAESGRSGPLWLIVSSGTALALGVGLIVLRVRQARRLDPNALPEEERRKFAATRGFVAGEEQECQRAAQAIVQARLGGETKYDVFVVAFMGLLGLGLGGYAAVAAIPAIIDGHASHAWPTTEGRVRQFAIAAEVPDRRKETVYYSPRVEYDYAVDGSEFHGQRIRMAKDSSTNRNDFVELETVLAPGNVVQVHYNPSDPAKSLLIPGVDTKDYLLGVGGVILFLFGVGAQIYTFVQWRKGPSV